MQTTRGSWRIPWQISGVFRAVLTVHFTLIWIWWEAFQKFLFSWYDCQLNGVGLITQGTQNPRADELHASGPCRLFVCFFTKLACRECRIGSFSICFSYPSSLGSELFSPPSSASSCAAPLSPLLSISHCQSSWLVLLGEIPSAKNLWEYFQPLCSYLRFCT